MKEIRYYALPLNEDNVNDEKSFITKAIKLGYEWNSEGFKQALDDKKLNLQGMWIKIIATERNI